MPFLFWFDFICFAYLRSYLPLLYLVSESILFGGFFIVLVLLLVKESIRGFCSAEGAWAVDESTVAIFAYTMSAVKVDVEFFVFVADVAFCHVV